jgi:adenylate kinase
LKLRAVVVGIPGVGKTTVVDKAVSSLEGGKLVSFGTVMLEEAKRRKWVKSRDQLRGMTVVRQRELQTLAARKIAGMRDSIVIVDTHLFIRTKEGFWPGLPYDVVRAMRPTHLVLVEASPREIASRRAGDAARYRDVVTHQGLEEELALARSYLAVSSTLSGAPMLIVANAEGKSDKAASVVVEALRSARP